MKLLVRLLFLVTCAALVYSTWSAYSSMTVTFAGHDTIYTQIRPWLREVRQWSLFAVLVLCLLLVRRDPVMVRIGLLSVIASLGVMLVPPREIHRAWDNLGDIRLAPKR